MKAHRSRKRILERKQMKIGQNFNQAGNRSASGFTLIENVVSLTIVAIMLTSLYGGFASGFSTVRTSRESQRATQIMLTKLEGIRLCNFSQLSNSLYNPATFTESFDPKDQAAGNGGTVYSGTFKASVPDVGVLPESYRTNMALVTVSVSWTSGKMQHTRSMQTYAARDGIEAYISVGK
jgi:prepilin-type N-terminal cleavage/methylation domain-containing protein